MTLVYLFGKFKAECLISTIHTRDFIVPLVLFGRRNVPSYSFMVLLSSPLFSTVAAENSAPKLV